MANDSIIEEIKQATDLVDLIRDHVAVQRRGKEYVCICPFHDDKKPSMTIVPDKQFYKCFACGAGGDAFSFVMDYHKMGFPDAKVFLADRANVTLPERGAAESDGPSPRKRIGDANTLAATYFQEQLRHDTAGKIARDYLADRGFGAEAIEQFGIGYAPDSWDALANGPGQPEHMTRDMTDAGLIGLRKSGQGHYDRFRHRLMFPILDVIGRTIAFGGRVLGGSSREDTSDAKYLNSPESPLFNKSATLYGLNLAHHKIATERCAIIVEGYTDVIAAHQAGFSNVVATLGTALTTEHAKTLRRYCDRVILIFDADEAGQKAADRALEIFFAERLDIGIVVLPDKADPADLLGRPDGPQLWKEAVEQAEDAMSFQYRRLRSAFDQDDTIAGRQRLTEEFLERLIGLGLRNMDRLRYGQVFARLAELLGMSPSAVADAVRDRGNHRHAPHASASHTPSTAAPLVGSDAEQTIIGCLLNRIDLLHTELSDGRELNESLQPGDFVDPQAAAIYGHLLEWFSSHDDTDSPDLRLLLTDESLAKTAMDWQAGIHKVAGTNTEALTTQLQAHGQALIGRRQELEYQDQKRQLRQQPTEADDHQRLALAIAHKNANPTAVVRPRTVH
jgi:DNA primase